MEYAPTVAIVNDLLSLCASAYRRRDFNEIERCCDQADHILQALKAVGNDQRRADVDHYRALVCQHKKQFSEAAGLFKNAFRIHERAGDSTSEWSRSDLLGLCSCLLADKRYADAIVYGNKALKFVAEGSLDEAQVQLDLARAYEQSNDAENSEKCERRALALFMQNKMYKGAAGLMHQIAATKQRERNFAQAAVFFHKEASLWQKARDRSSQARAENAAKVCQAAARKDKPK